MVNTQELVLGSEESRRQNNRSIVRWIQTRPLHTQEDSSSNRYEILELSWIPLYFFVGSTNFEKHKGSFYTS